MCRVRGDHWSVLYLSASSLTDKPTSMGGILRNQTERHERDLHTVQTPGEVQDHIRIISVDSQVSHTVRDDDMTSFRQRVRLKDSESTLSFILWNGCIPWIIKTVHKATVKQSLNRFSPLSSIHLDAKFPLSFTPQPFYSHTFACSAVATVFSKAATVSRSLIRDQWKVCVLLQKCCSAALPQYKHKDFPFNCPGEHLGPIKAKSWDCPVNGIWFLRWSCDSYGLLNPSQVN